MLTELYGIFFKNSIDTRRLWTDYKLSNFPFKKDFPVSGFTELYYIDSVNSFNYYPVKFTQEFRDYTYYNPWLNKLSNIWEADSGLFTKVESYDFLKEFNVKLDSLSDFKGSI
jgi:hypothetical protein